jgi:two-component system chemotaxis response regulator CheB
MKVLIVDDSIVFRTAIKTVLLDSGDIAEIDVAANGKIAIQKLQQKKFDGVTLDLEMPVMDGIETIKEIRKFDKDLPIIIFSAQNIKAANKTITALEMGANDFVQKLQGSSDVQENLKLIQKDLVPKFKALVERNFDRKVTAPVAQREKIEINQSIHNFKADILCIGSSTGGPDMLMKVFAGLKPMKVPMVLVQHMPPLFTTQLAAALDRIGVNKVVEAKIGDILEPGTCYLAPGDFHMRIKKHNEFNYIISLDQSEKVCYVRPAVDVLYDSVAEVFNGKIGAFIFTGMGNDGAKSCKKIKEKGGAVVIQDEESSVVWGMPRAVFENKAYDDIMNPEELISAMNKFGS